VSVVSNAPVGGMESVLKCRHERRTAGSDGGVLFTNPNNPHFCTWLTGDSGTQPAARYRKDFCGAFSCFTSPGAWRRELSFRGYVPKSPLQWGDQGGFG